MFVSFSCFKLATVSLEEKQANLDPGLKTAAPSSRLNYILEDNVLTQIINSNLIILAVLLACDGIIDPNVDNIDAHVAIGIER